AVEALDFGGLHLTCGAKHIRAKSRDAGRVDRRPRVLFHLKDYRLRIELGDLDMALKWLGQLAQETFDPGTGRHRAPTADQTILHAPHHSDRRALPPARACAFTEEPYVTDLIANQRKQSILQLGCHNPLTLCLDP